jgi:hypothetical protein
VTKRAAQMPPRVAGGRRRRRAAHPRAGTFRALHHHFFVEEIGAMRAAGFVLMGVGVLIVGAAFLPQVSDDTLRYALAAIGPCIGGLGAWLVQEAGTGKKR